MQMKDAKSAVMKTTATTLCTPPVSLVQLYLSAPVAGAQSVTVLIL